MKQCNESFVRSGGLHIGGCCLCGRNKNLGKNRPLRLDDTADDKVTTQGSTFRDITGNKSLDELQGFSVCFFLLDNVDQQMIKLFNNLAVA